MTSPQTGTVLVANPGADLYGSDRMMLESVRGLAQAGWRVVVTLPHEGPLAPLVAVRGGEVVVCRAPVVRKAALRPAGAFHLAADTLAGVIPGWRVLRSIRPDVLYVNTVTSPLWFVLAKILRIPVVCHIHEAEGSYPRAVLRLLYAPLLTSRGILINSNYAKRVLQQAWPRVAARAELARNAVAGPDTGPTPARARLDPPVRIVYVGRLSARKGPHVAIEALAGLRDSGTAATLELVGDVYPGYEAYRDHLHRLAADFGVTADVTFVGFVPMAWDHLAGADIVVVPSTVDEPFGNTAVEAALAARPSVVSDIAGLKEATAGFGATVRVPAGDSNALAAGIREIVQAWPVFVAQAAEDAQWAAGHYAPVRYGQQVAAAVAAVAWSGRRVVKLNGPVGARTRDVPH